MTPRSRGFVSSSSLSRGIFDIPGRGGGPGRTRAIGVPPGGVSEPGGLDGDDFGGIVIDPGGFEGGFGGIAITPGGRDDVFGE